MGTTGIKCLKQPLVQMAFIRAIQGNEEWQEGILPCSETSCTVRQRGHANTRYVLPSRTCIYMYPPHHRLPGQVLGLRPFLGIAHAKQGNEQPAKFFYWFFATWLKCNQSLVNIIQPNFKGCHLLNTLVNLLFQNCTSLANWFWLSASCLLKSWTCFRSASSLSLNAAISCDAWEWSWVTSSGARDSASSTARLAWASTCWTCISALT